MSILCAYFYLCAYLKRVDLPTPERRVMKMPILDKNSRIALMRRQCQGDSLISLSMRELRNPAPEVRCIDILASLRCSAVRLTCDAKHARTHAIKAVT